MSENERLLNPISTAELERRWAAVRAAMEQQGIDALVMQNHNEFLGGYVKWFTDTPAKNAYPRSVIFPRNDPMVVVSPGPFGGVRELAAGDELNPGVSRILTTPSFASVHYTGSYDADLIAGELKRRGDKTVGLVGTGGMSHAFGETLKNGNLGGAKLVDATEMVDRIKAVKSPEEMERIEQTAAMQDKVIAEIAKAIKPGMRDFEVTALAQYIGQTMGSEQGIFLGTSAAIDQPSAFAQKHLQGRMLREGDYLPLLVENNGFGGFYAEISRTFVLGKASQQLREGFEKVREAQRHTLDNLKPGARASDVFRAHNEYMRSIGLPAETRLYCHSQGYDMVERPLVRDDETMVIAENMNFAVHPGFNTPSFFAVICDNYLIGPNGPGDCLHKTPKEIIEV